MANGFIENCFFLYTASGAILLTKIFVLKKEFVQTKQQSHIKKEERKDVANNG